MIEAAVFDLDGVLVDSEHLWNEVREALAAADLVLESPAELTAARVRYVRQ